MNHLSVQAGTAARRVGARKALCGAAAAACVLALPAMAQASPRPTADASGAALCAGVSSSKVSSIVGFSVPSAITTTQSSYFDKALNIHGNTTVCTYGAATSLASLGKIVTISYESLSSAPPESAALAEIKAGFAKAEKNMPKGSTATYSLTSSGGVTLLFAQVSATIGGIKFTFEFDYGWKGTKVAGAMVESAIPKSKLVSLESAAQGNFGGF